MPAAPGDDARTPVSLLTGFLGSGKTTVLRHVLGHPAFADTAVLINEFGEIGLDHLLVGRVEGAPVLLGSGCACCSIRDDLGRAMRDLDARRQRGEIPPFRRMIVETTGLADPRPILATVTSDLALRRRFRVANVIATVDALHGASGLRRHAESLAQAATADRLLITKADLAPAAQIDALRDTLRRINPAAVIVPVANGGIDPDLVLREGLHDPETRLAEVRRWLASCARLLRVKGLLDVEDSATPVVVHAVQHMIHEPEHLPGWPATTARESRLVFITDGLDGDLVQRSFSAFCRLG